MRIDPDLEQHLRDAYSGVVGQDADRIQAAMAGLDENEIATILDLALYVCTFILFDVYPDGLGELDIQDVAGDIVAEEAGWIELGGLEKVTNYIRAVATGGGSGLDGLDVEDVLVLTLVCSGHLLATYYEDDKHWWDYLNKIWAAFQATVPGDANRPGWHAATRGDLSPPEG